MTETIETLIGDRAAQMAAHDGAPEPTAAHIHGAANWLQAEILRVRDYLLGPRPAPAVEDAPAAEEPVAEEPAPAAEEAPAEAAPAPAAEESAPAEEPAS